MAEPSESPPRSSSVPDLAVWKPALREAAWALLAAAIVLIVVYAIAFKNIHPEFVQFMGQDAKPLTAAGEDFIPISIGEGRKDGGRYIVEDFNGDEAILALPRTFRAEDYPFIKVNLEGFTRYSKLKILWRQADNLSQTHALELNRSGDGATQVAMVYGGESYRGRIADVALLVYDGPALGFENNNGEDISIKSIEFRPFSAWRVAEQIYEDWTNPPLLKGYSNNIVRGIHTNGMLFPNVVANLLIVTGMLIAVIFRKMRIHSRGERAITPTFVVALSLCFYGWILNDALRWHWRVEQLLDSHQRYAALPLEQRIRNSPIRCSRFPENCKAELLPFF